MTELNLCPKSGSRATPHPILSFGGCWINTQGYSPPSFPTTLSQAPSIGPWCSSLSCSQALAFKSEVTDSQSNRRGRCLGCCLRTCKGNTTEGLMSEKPPPFPVPILIFLKCSLYKTLLIPLSFEVSLADTPTSVGAHVPWKPSYYPWGSRSIPISLENTVLGKSFHLMWRDKGEAAESGIREVRGVECFKNSLCCQPGQRDPVVRETKISLNLGIGGKASWG